MWKFICNIENKYLSELFRPSIFYIICVFLIIPLFEKTAYEKGIIIKKDVIPFFEILLLSIVFFIIFRIAFYSISWKKFKVLALKASKSNSIAFYFHMQNEYIKEGIVKKILCFAIGLYILQLCFACMPSLINESENYFIILAIPPVLIYFVFSLFEIIKPFVSEVTSLCKLIISKPENITLTGAALFLYQGVSSDSEIYKKEKQQLEKLFEEVQKNTIKDEKKSLEKRVVQNIPRQAKKRL